MMRARFSRGFTLVEVVLAVGVFAVTIVGLLALLTPTAKSTAEISDYARASALGDGIQGELERLRDANVGAGRLDALHDVVAANTPLKLVASADATRVLRESDAVAAGLSERDWHFLIEIREQPAPLNYTAGAAFLALTATVKWPYKIPSGETDVTDADLTQASSLMLNFAISP
ncbi:prepilin-type N-terminal cleavage/methylation domain-containing protein [Horticoccus luteus]|uniref:Prepilin-type N-terminal cleavage/methylation domain-containing protein n=1 Tax=Horticoccus luteus TaxID=2862869 RepID=A0A8F9TVY3_9BACT|nr:prepilin-type N-terminal cleavage/methylation domain-containing protein [Horticoccus luteus]QYM80116.1 prepilin-type N-terminal cleavage/methylation domain-containing protein [Horticoccus luteus]